MSKRVRIINYLPRMNSYEEMAERMKALIEQYDTFRDTEDCSYAWRLMNLQMNAIYLSLVNESLWADKTGKEDLMKEARLALILLEKIAEKNRDYILKPNNRLKEAEHVNLLMMIEKQISDLQFIAVGGSLELKVNG